MAAHIKEWDQQDRTDLREFLNKHSNLIPLFLSRRTKLEGKTLEERALNGAKAEGFEDAVKELQSFSDPIKEDPTVPEVVDVATD